VIGINTSTTNRAEINLPNSISKYPDAQISISTQLQ